MKVRTRWEEIKHKMAVEAIAMDLTEAFAELCKELGFKAQKMWGYTFADLVKAGIE